METPETFLSLLQNTGHWEFELLLLAIFDGLIGLVLWPWIRSKLLHHKSDDKKIEELEKQVSEMRAIMGLTNDKDKQ